MSNTTTENKPVPEVAFRKGFHRLTAYDMNCQCRAALKTCPTCEFEGSGGRQGLLLQTIHGEERLWQ